MVFSNVLEDTKGKACLSARIPAHHQYDARRVTILSVSRSVALFCAVLAAANVLVRAQASIPPPGDRRPATLTKPRIAPLSPDRQGDAHRQLAEKFPKASELDGGFTTLLNVPPLADAVMPYTIYLSDQSTLTARHRELLVLRTAWLGNNQVVWSSHAVRARAAGLSASEIHRIAEGPRAPGWTAFETTLLRLADELYRNSSVSGATWAALAAAYDEHHLMDAVETVNHFTMLSMMYNSFGIQPGEGTGDRLPLDVPYRVDVPAREPALTSARVEPMPGDGIAVSRTLARHPKLNEARARRANFINRVSKLQPRHREMLILRIGWDCRSEYRVGAARGQRRSRA